MTSPFSSTESNKVSGGRGGRRGLDFEDAVGILELVGKREGMWRRGAGRDVGRSVVDCDGTREGEEDGSQEGGVEVRWVGEPKGFVKGVDVRVAVG
jgi:hypothetical protein